MVPECVCVFMYSAFKYKRSPRLPTSFPESTVFFPKTNRSDKLPYKEFPTY